MYVKENEILFVDALCIHVSVRLIFRFPFPFRIPVGARLPVQVGLFHFLASLKVMLCEQKMGPHLRNLDRC